MYNNTIASSIISIIFHLLIVLWLALYFELTPSEKLLGDPNTVIIASYIHADQAPSAKQSIIDKKQVNQTITAHKQVDLKADIALKRLQKTAAATPPASPMSQQSHGDSASELLELLHAAIQAHQSYPPSAAMMEREGRVTLGFVLLVDGTVHALRVLASSGSESLDEAALSAVREALPFRQVDQYLTSPQDYQIDVVFKLT